MLAKQHVLRSLGIIALSFVLGFVALWWLSHDLVAQAAKVQSARQGISREADLIASFATLKSDAVKADEYERHLSSLLPSKDQLINFHNFLDVLASQRRVQTNFSFEGSGSPSGDASLSSIDFRLEISGSLSGILGLLEDIELKPKSYLLSLGDFTISDSSEGYRVVFHGKLFYKETGNQE